MVKKINFKPNLDTVPLNFGKHKGKTPEEICREDPGYLIWMWNTMERPPVSRQLMLAAENEKTMQDHDNFEDDELEQTIRDEFQFGDEWWK